MNEETVGDRIVKIAENHFRLEHLGRAELAFRLGVTYETLRKWINGDAAPSRRRAELISNLLNAPVEMFMHGVNYAPDNVFVHAQESAKQVAQSVSQKSAKVHPPSSIQLIRWKDRETMEAHERFSVIAPDDSMAPILLAGTRVVFDRTLVGEERNKDVVLLEDAAGEWYIRTYLKATGGRFEAKPEHSDYVKMDRDTDGLKVLAVMIGTDGRRG